ncbi:hypothetical protein SMICM304S_03555 [Streptomyces microflavus]
MWAAIDGRRYDVAKAHMREAQSLAEMSGDQAIKFRIWSHAGTMYRHMGRPPTRAPPTMSPATSTSPAATRCSHAWDMPARLPPSASPATPQPYGMPLAVLRTHWNARIRIWLSQVWMAAVHDGAELETLALSAHLRLGNFEQAESHAPPKRPCSALRCSATAPSTPPGSRAPGQGEADAATATAMKVPADAATRHARVSRMLQEVRVRAPRHRPAQHHRPDLDRAHHHLEDGRMTTAPATELRTFTSLDAIRGDLLDVYAEVRAPLLHLPNYAVTSFGERIDRHAAEPGSQSSSRTRTGTRSATGTATPSSTATATGNG